MTALERAIAELEDAEWQLEQITKGVARGTVPADALHTAQWWLGQCQRRVEELSGATDAP